MTDQPTEGQVRPFADVLRDIQGGTVADDAAQAMQDLVNSVREHGRKGELTIKVIVQPLKGNDTALSVSGEVALKPPRPEPATAVFFYDSAGNLLRDNPRQIALPGLREVGRPTYDNVKEL